MFPKFIRIKQNYKADRIDDIESAVRNSVLASGCGPDKLSGKQIGIAVGSRGIINIDIIVRTVVIMVKECGGIPVIFPAMGSHGGTSEEGQKEILASIGITGESTGAAIRSTRNCVLYGTTDSGMKVYGNDLAPGFDGIILINRIKQHTDFDDITESGLLKLLAIGVGNREGAEHIHASALRLGYGPAIREAGLFMLKKLPVIMGLAITENWKHETNRIQAILPEDILKAEMKLLQKVKEDAIKLPVDSLDSIIIQRAGKSISGTCVDTKVIGRIMIAGQKEPEAPRIKTVAVLDFTEDSHGNAMGMGVVDIITRRAFDKIDVTATSLTGMTSTCLLQSKIPCVAPTDRQAISTAFRCTGLEDPGTVRAAYIRDTNSLEHMAVTLNVYNEIKDNPLIEAEGDPFDLEFDSDGNLQTVF